MVSRQLGVALILGCLVTTGCQRPTAAAKPAPPATVARPVKENELNTVTLTGEAETRLGIELASAERRTTPRLRIYGGEVTLPPNATLNVLAPVSGTLQIPKGEELPRVGAVVRKGQAMFALLPHIFSQAEHITVAQAKLQLAQAKIDAEGQFKQAKVQMDAGEVAFQRAERLFREMAGTKKDLDDALAQLQLAQKTFDAASLRKSVVDAMELDTSASAVKPLAISAPEKGIVRATYAAAGEMVPAGSPLFDVMNMDKVWIKASVYVGEASDIDEKEPAHVKSLADRAGARDDQALPVESPPTAQPLASAVDFYYELDNPKGKYRPGQRVSAMLKLRGAEKSLGLPWSAVVHDIYGGAWVYVQTAPRTYARQRLQIRQVTGDWATFAEGPAEGAKIVSAGAAELFGAEFGFGH